MKENTLSNIDDRQRGMTLIELLAALLIAGMLTGWGVGQWRHHQQTLRTEHTAQQLLAFLLRLQADANWRNRTTLLWFKNGTPGAWAGVCRRRIALPPRVPFSHRLIATSL